mmetsp:Transcript_43969/g.86229  ORF Transcript_43969/g.86229 Transcript_43969/m.86229 type:complete len:516 (+) Transcript_43969:196-1743(+)
MIVVKRLGVRGAAAGRGLLVQIGIRIIITQFRILRPTVLSAGEIAPVPGVFAETVGASRPGTLQAPFPPAVVVVVAPPGVRVAGGSLVPVRVRPAAPTGTAPPGGRAGGTFTAGEFPVPLGPAAFAGRVPRSDAGKGGALRGRGGPAGPSPGAGVRRTRTMVAADGSVPGRSRAPGAVSRAHGRRSTDTVGICGSSVLADVRERAIVPSVRIPTRVSEAGVGPGTAVFLVIKIVPVAAFVSLQKSQADNVAIFFGIQSVVVPGPVGAAQAIHRKRQAAFQDGIHFRVVVAADDDGIFVTGNYWRGHFLLEIVICMGTVGTLVPIDGVLRKVLAFAGSSSDDRGTRVCHYFSRWLFFCQPGSGEELLDRLEGAKKIRDQVERIAPQAFPPHPLDQFLLRDQTVPLALALPDALDTDRRARSGRLVLHAEGIFPDDSHAPRAVSPLPQGAFEHPLRRVPAREEGTRVGLSHRRHRPRRGRRCRRCKEFDDGDLDVLRVGDVAAVDAPHQDHPVARPA